MKRPECSTIAWGVLIGGVAVYDAACPPNQTLSEGFDRLIEKHPVVAMAAVGAVALHLLNVYENYGLEKYDVIHRVASLRENVK